MFAVDTDAGEAKKWSILIICLCYISNTGVEFLWYRLRLGRPDVITSGFMSSANEEHEKDGHSNTRRVIDTPVLIYITHLTDGRRIARRKCNCNDAEDSVISE